jgi:hypothetical protein
MAMDRYGNVFVTGFSSNDGNGGTRVDDYATVAYSSAGMPLWTNRYDGPANQGDEPSAIAVDNTGNVFVTGFSDNPVDDSIWSDYATIKYSDSGIPLWVNNYDGPASRIDWAKAIAIDSGGNVFVTGFSETGDFPIYFREYATFGYSNSGELLWEQHYGGLDSWGNEPSAIAVDHAGNVFVTGYSSLSDGSWYYTTIKYSSSLPPPVTLDYQRIDSQLVLSWTNAGSNLQSAPSLTGTFTNIPGARSPYTNSLAPPQQFFRLIGN